jgi:hypothetical protein
VKGAYYCISLQEWYYTDFGNYCGTSLLSMSIVVQEINEHATNSNSKNITDLNRRIYAFKMGYKTGSNFVKNENGEQLADSHHSLYK